MAKIVAKDPLSIGGRWDAGSPMRRRPIRDLLPKAWEARIRYYNCFIYDRQLIPGMPYTVEEGQLRPVAYAAPVDLLRTIKARFTHEAAEFMDYVERWITLLQCPIPAIHRAALDIEVQQSVATRMPDASTAPDPIICAAVADSDGRRRVLLLRRSQVEDGENRLSPEVQVEYYDEERRLVAELLATLSAYPMVVTFNGDEFDLNYLYHRAERLGFARDDVPIILGNRFAHLTRSIHLDLYKFFFNRSIQIYAFSKKYDAVSLDAVATALLGEGKLDVAAEGISTLSILDLARYCLQDTELTLRLTTFDDSLVMKLLIVLQRVTKMPMEDLTRQGVSSWIRNLMYYEHRRANVLIPRTEDILQVKGEASTAAIIKGKKFKGAIVVEPKPGIHFDVAVLDFASLYPSIIKVHNLSYETVLCPHPECRANTIPGVPHWVCTLRRGLSSLIIGSLRDMRVKWYKQRAKDASLTPTLRNLYQVIQLTLKVVLNASYGVMGASAFSLFCPPVAEAVTAIGRNAITETVQKAQTLGIDVIYGDTDSVFLKAPTRPQIDELVGWSDTTLGMELEIEKFYRYAVFSHLKKNYLGVYRDGNVDIKGLTGKKRHMPGFLKAAFLEMIAILGEVQNQDAFEAAQEKIRTLVRACYAKLKQQRYTLDELSLNVMIGKPLERYTKTTPQHVKAARLAVQAGREVKPGDVIAFVKTSDELGVKPLDLARIEDVDVGKYVEYLKSTFDQVLDPLEIDFDEILGVTKLETFLWGGS
jgi:DNA polymerase I